GEHGEDAPGVRAHHHRGAQTDLPRARRGDGEKGPLPTGGDVDGKGPCFGEIRGFARAAFGGQIAELTGELILRAVERVAVEGAGAGVHPKARGCGGGRDDLAEQERRLDARVKDGLTICRVIAVVDRASGEMDDCVAAVYFCGPGTGCEAIPRECAPWMRGMRLGRAREHGDLVAVRMKMPREDRADLSGAAGEKDS